MTMKFKAGQLVHWTKEAYVHGRAYWFWDPNDNTNPTFLLLSFDGEYWKALKGEGHIVTLHKKTVEGWMEVISET